MYPLHKRLTSQVLHNSTRTDGPELLPLLDDVVEEVHGAQEIAPGGMVGVVCGE